MLHILSTNNTEDFFHSLAVIHPSDQVIILGDIVNSEALLLLASEKLKNLWIVFNNAAPATIAAQNSSITPIDFEQFVELSVNNNPVMTWY